AASPLAQGDLGPADITRCVARRKNSGWCGGIHLRSPSYGWVTAVDTMRSALQNQMEQFGHFLDLFLERRSFSLSFLPCRIARTAALILSLVKGNQCAGY